MRAAGFCAVVACLAASSGAEDPGRKVEIIAQVLQARAGAEPVLLAMPSVVCAEGSEAEIHLGRFDSDGAPDAEAIRMQLTPRVLDDGRIEIKVVSLGSELGMKPEPGRGQGAAQAESAPVFHSALPAEKLFSLAGRSGQRRWLRLGQSIEGWTVESFEPASATLSLRRGQRTQRLILAKPSGGEPDPLPPRIVTVAMLPGRHAEILGKDGRRLVIKARLFERAPPR